MTTIMREERAAAPTRWKVDADKTFVEFAVDTFWGLSTVRGRFDRFDGRYEVGPDGMKIEATIDANSLHTGNRKRDEHLRSVRLLRRRRAPAGAVHVDPRPPTR